MRKQIRTAPLRNGRAMSDGFVPRLERLEVREVPANFTVDDSGGADFLRIQDAVDAAALTKGPDQIRVFPGTYTEQVTVAGSKLDGLTLRSVKPLQAVIQAPPTTSATGTAKYASIVRITDAEKVTLDGFTITGPSKTLEVGVYVDSDASATIRDNRITDIRPLAALGGDQIGIGILAESESEVKIFKNTIEKYQKGGIVIFDKGSFADVSQNTITGSGPTTVIAQNGVQVNYGASAKIFQNRITDNSYAVPDVGTNVTDAAGIIVGGPIYPGDFDIRAGAVSVSQNELFRNEVGVLAENQTAPLSISHNDIRNSDKDGIALYGVVGAEVSHNKVSGSRETGLRVSKQSTIVSPSNVQSQGNYIFNNVFVGSGAVDIFDDTVGTGTGGTANVYKNNRYATSNRTVD